MLNEEHLISIIIPIYNTEQHLQLCLDGILGQTNQNFEILLINDGSTDNSQKICQEYASRDSRILVFSQPNSGVSSARNQGLKYAKGKWVVFIDSDDWISPDFLHLDKEDENGDIIQKSVETHNFKGEVINSKLITKKEIITDKEHIFRHCINQKTNALWNKIISRELIGNLQFDESLRIGEDLIFFLSLIQKTSRYILSPTGIYHYIIHQESIMQTAKKDPVACIRSTLNLVPKIKDSTIEHPRIYKGIIAETIFIQLYRKRKFFSSEERKRIKNIIDEIRWKDLIYIPVRKKIKFLWKKIMWYMK